MSLVGRARFGRDLDNRGTRLLGRQTCRDKRANQLHRPFADLVMNVADLGALLDGACPLFQILAIAASLRLYWHGSRSEARGQML
jgi:hypothetical protein